MALRRLPFLARLSGRYAMRHKGQTVRAILGLFVASTVLLTGFGIADSFTNSFLGTELKRLGNVEVTLRAGMPFDAVDADAWLAAPDVAAEGTRGAASLVVEGSALHPAKRLAEASAHVRGMPASERAALGPLRDAAGAEIAEPGENETVLDVDLAARLEAAPGDEVVLRVPGADGRPVNLTARVAGVIPAAGRGAVVERPVALVRLSDLQAATGAAGKANLVLATADGDDARAADALRAALPAGVRETAEVSAVQVAAKARAAEEEGGFLGFIMVMGGFTLIASGILAFALIGSLVEERRAELGIARALGMTRGEVALLMTMEGALYSAVAAAAGVLAGLGLIRIFIGIMQRAVEAWETPGVVLATQVEPTSIILAFVIGTALPLAVMAGASLRFARIDPARAIRGIPDDPKRRRTAGTVAAVVLVAAGTILSIWPIPRLVGIPLLAMGIAVGFGTWGRPGLAGLAGLGGVAHILWSLYAFDDFPADMGELDPMMTMARGLVLAVMLVVLAVASPTPYLLLARLAGGGGRAMRASFVALKYLVARRGSAGLTIAMIALVVLVVITMGTLMTLFASEIGDTEAGYHVIGRSPLLVAGFAAPLPADVGPDVERTDFVPTHGGFLPLNLSRGGTPIVALNDWAAVRRVVGVTDGFAEANDYKLLKRDARYATDRDAWRAVARGEAVILGRWNADDMKIAVGETLDVRGGSGATHAYVVAGTVDARLAEGFLAANRTTEMGAPLGSLALLRVVPGADPDHVAHRLTADLGDQGFAFESRREQAAKETQGMRAFVLFFEAFLGLGLFVGLAATGFLASRAVHARTRDIGTLRALGLEPAEVRAAFVIESGATAVLGLVIGVGVGTLIAHTVWWREIRETGVAFAPPLAVVAAFVAAVLVLAAFAAWAPARRAAGLAPAAAVRHVD